MAFDVRLYFSGSVEEPVNRFILEQPDSFRLFTYAYPKEAYEYLNLADEMGVRTRLIMDSGAFTSWNIGKPVQLPDLIAYNEDILKNYGDRHEFLFISLDVIPGDRGRRPTPEELAHGVEQSKANFATLQEHFAGRAQYLPVYHTGEDFGLRDWYMARTDSVCLSMDQAMSERDRLAWAKRAAVPGFKYHGLAATGNRMVTEVPWFSVDSSSWVTVGSMGGLLWPTSDNRFRVLPISENSPSRHTAGQHIRTLTPYERGRAEDLIAARGFDPAEMAVSHQQRWKWNVLMWMDPPWVSKTQAPIDLFEGFA